MEVAVTGKAKLKPAWVSLLFKSNVLAVELLQALIWKKKSYGEQGTDEKQIAGH